MITIFYIIETILIYFYSLGFSLNARPHKRQRFNHHRVEIKVVVVVVVVVVVPEWVSFLFWLMLFGFQSPYHSLVEGIIAFADVAGIFIRGPSESILTDLSLSLMY